MVRAVSPAGLDLHRLLEAKISKGTVAAYDESQPQIIFNRYHGEH